MFEDFTNCHTRHKHRIDNLYKYCCQERDNREHQHKRTCSRATKTLKTHLEQCYIYYFTAIITIYLLTVIEYVDSMPNSGPNNNTNEWYRAQEDLMVKYLGRFGYLTDASQETGPASLTSRETYVQALKRLQRMANIPETGEVDSKTYELLSKPRCGVKDEIGLLTMKRSRRRRYIVASSKWEKNDITYKILNTTPDLDAQKVRRIISDAFKVWSDVTTLTFSEVINAEADIMIEFVVGHHHDGYAFDGPGSVLAHAFFPGEGTGGDTHFDDDETWRFYSSEGVDLFMVAAHEFGHALGLQHSSNTDALMYPWYQGYVANFKLPYDDIQGIQSVYGGKSQVLPPVTMPRPEIDVTAKPRTTPRYPPYVTTPTKTYFRTPEAPSINPCSHSIDAISVIRNELFIFIGPQCWRLGSYGRASGPTTIASFWNSILEGGVDAVYEKLDGTIVFFKGNRFWLFHATRIVSNFPKEGRLLTELGIDKDIKKIDAAFIWAYNQQTYLVSGDIYWKLNNSKDYIEYDYPRDMSIWKNVPLPVDSAFQHWDGRTYFLQGDKYWEFYDTKMQTRHIEGKPISALLGCRNGVMKSDFTAFNVDSPAVQPQTSEASFIVKTFQINIVIFICSLHLFQ